MNRKMRQTSSLFIDRWLVTNLTSALVCLIGVSYASKPQCSLTTYKVKLDLAVNLYLVANPYRDQFTVLNLNEKNNDIFFIHQSNCFTALQLAVVQRRVKELRSEQACQFFDGLVVKRAWNMWLERCDECEEVRVAHLTKQALDHRR